MRVDDLHVIARPNVAIGIGRCDTIEVAESIKRQSRSRHLERRSVGLNHRIALRLRRVRVRVAAETTQGNLSHRLAALRCERCLHLLDLAQRSCFTDKHRMPNHWISHRRFSGAHG